MQQVEQLEYEISKIEETNEDIKQQTKEKIEDKVIKKRLSV